MNYLHAGVQVLPVTGKGDAGKLHVRALPVQNCHRIQIGNMASEGTTPRQLTDLLGSLSDLTSGSGDKGTPVVFIQGYFDTYAEQ